MVEINITKPTKINIKTIRMYLKIRDEMSFSLYDSEKSCIATYEGYVPHVLIPGGIWRLHES